MTTLETARLDLRPLRANDIEPWVAMFTDPDVMQYVGSSGPMSRKSAEEIFEQHRQLLDMKGYGCWVIDVKGGPAFAGVILLEDFPLTAPFTPALEIGWVLPHNHWGKGYATEGARAILDYAFAVLNLDKVVSGTRAGQVRARVYFRRELVLRG
jgi:RimJ/RimL family protein N-acetyltransferase